MTVPGYFEPVSQFVDRTRTLGAPDHQTNRGSAEITDGQHYIHHWTAPPDPLITVKKLDAGEGDCVDWGMRLSAEDERSYTLGMDSVRFGRALGTGARAAAKTLVAAADAAASQNPSGGGIRTQSGAQTRVTAASPTVAGGRLVDQAVKTTAQVLQNKEGLAWGGKQFSQTVWGNFTRLSGVLWLEFTGVFFGIFALFAATGAWKLRGSLHETAANHDDHVHLLVLIGVAVGFGYFFVSSFLRASRKSRRR
jgi:hypothetical protein